MLNNNLDEDTIIQIWAECVHYYREGEKLYLPADIEKMAVEAQRDAMETDEREGLVKAYLERLLPEGWDEMDLDDRRDFLNNNSSFIEPRVGTESRETVVVCQIT